MRTIARTKRDVRERLLGDRADIEELGVRRLGLFGSLVRGDQGPHSDVDLLVEFEPEGKTFDNFARLSFLLKEMLQRRVELVTTDSLSSYIGPRIIREVEYVFPLS